MGVMPTQIEDAQPATNSQLTLHGVRVNNLKNFDLSLPLGKLIVVTGVSGSGKSSLAYDVIYAEGQRRFAETFPPNVRQHLPQFDRPDIDRAENIPVAIAVGQFDSAGSKKATVAEAAGLLDLLRPLLAYWSDAVCPNCKTEIFHATPQRLSQHLAEHHRGEAVSIGFPAPPGFDAETAKSFVASGFIRAEFDGVIIRLVDSQVPWEAKSAFILVDRLTLDASEAQTKRLIDAFDLAKRFGVRMAVKLADGWRVFENALVCPSCGLTMPPPMPAFFHRKNPASQCQECEGAGAVSRIDLGLLIPDRSRSLREGAVAPLAEETNADLRREFLKGAKAAGLDIDSAIAGFSAYHAAMLQQGDPPSGFLGLDGVVSRLRSAGRRNPLVKYESEFECEACRGSGLGPGPLAFQFEGRTYAEWLSGAIDQSRGLRRG
jgi:excinuclease ABC subunit A